VTNLATARVQWDVPLADAAKVGYFDYWVDLKPFAEAQITRLPDTAANAVWQAKLPTTLTKGLHAVQVRSCKTGAKDPNIDCSAWVGATFEVNLDGSVRPPQPGNLTVITVTVAVTTSKQP
jgi:hypothetical protein